jgi:hypothetical protein
MDRLIRELGSLEGWSDAEIEEKLAERRRMAPGRVPEALRELRAKAAASLAPWPERPAKRSRIILCVIQGGKAKNEVKHQHEPEAA